MSEESADGSISQAEYDGFFGRLTGKEGTIGSTAGPSLATVRQTEPGGKTISFSIGKGSDPADKVGAVVNGPSLASVTTGVIQARPGEKASDAAYRWLAENPQHGLERSGLGPVVFNEASIKKSLGHGFSGPKLNALTAVPEVIRNGTLIDVSMDHTGEDLRNWIIVGPVEIDGTRHQLFARLRADTTAKSLQPHFYVHEVILDSTFRK
ncbi:MAG: hypothetical protein KF712_04620 [Akkermansiaceae bacterium]|nr:hypothetical protein [Akkermansiaceae bacterium]